MRIPTFLRVFAAVLIGATTALPLTLLGPLGLGVAAATKPAPNPLVPVTCTTFVWHQNIWEPDGSQQVNITGCSGDGRNYRRAVGNFPGTSYVRPPNPTGTLTWNGGATTTLVGSAWTGDATEAGCGPSKIGDFDGGGVLTSSQFSIRICNYFHANGLLQIERGAPFGYYKWALAPGTVAVIQP